LVPFELWAQLSTKPARGVCAALTCLIIRTKLTTILRITTFHRFELLTVPGVRIGKLKGGCIEN